MSARDRLLAALSPDLVAALDELIAERVEVALARVMVSDRPEWLTLGHAGELLGCSADAVRMRVRRGRLEARRQGRRLYVSAASVERLA